MYIYIYIYTHVGSIYPECQFSRDVPAIQNVGWDTESQKDIHGATCPFVNVFNYDS